MTMTSLVFVLIPGTLGREINGLACDGWVVDDPPQFGLRSPQREPIGVYSGVRCRYLMPVRIYI